MKLWRRALRWTGFIVMAFGAITMVWSLVVIVQIQTGWGLTRIEQCCSRGGTYALALLVSGMFFFLVGAGTILISRLGIQGEVDRVESSRWMRALPGVLFVCGAAAIVIASVFAGMGDEFGDATVGIVSYCMLIGVGLLFAGWGLKRARDDK
jgi:hypothetical protein